MKKTADLTFNIKSENNKREYVKKYMEVMKSLKTSGIPFISQGMVGSERYEDLYPQYKGTNNAIFKFHSIDDNSDTKIIKALKDMNITILSSIKNDKVLILIINA